MISIIPENLKEIYRKLKKRVSGVDEALDAHDAWNIRIIDEEEDPVRDEVMRRVMNSGKPVMATVDESGNVTYSE